MKSVVFFSNILFLKISFLTGYELELRYVMVPVVLLFLLFKGNGGDSNLEIPKAGFI